MPTSALGRLFKGDSPPPEQEQSDLWVNQTDNGLYRHDGVNFKLLAGGGAVTPNTVVNASGDYVATATGLDIFVDCTGAPRTVTLPTPVGNGGGHINVVKTDASANSLTITGTGISLTITVQNTSVTLASDGTAWRIV